MRKLLLSLALGLMALGGALIAVNPPSLAYLLISSSAPPRAYVGAGDITPFTVWVGFRAYTAAIAAAGTQPLVNVIRASDSHNCDIIVATSGGMGLTGNCGIGGDNGQSASSFCNATTCAFKGYNQVSPDTACGGASCNLDNNAGNAFPSIVFNCINTTLACGKADVGVGQMLETSNNFTPSSRALSVSFVALNTSPFVNTIPFQENGVDNFLQVPASNTWTFAGGNAGTISATAADDAFHAFNYAIALTPTTSTANADGTETTSTNVNNDTAAGRFVAWRSLTGGILEQTEIGFVDGTTWPLSIRSKLCDNQGTWWGTSKGTHCNSSGT